MITTESKITRNGRADSALTCSASVGPDFATNGEQTTTNPFAVYGERAQLYKGQLFSFNTLSVFHIGEIIEGTVSQKVILPNGSDTGRSVIEVSY